ncbi:hypothetical protein C0J52_17256 [Blattella germanica]|nr:hypothetical protein C0J52_17256 [Blattella germanica]
MLRELKRNMERWEGRVAVVTGASAGIGAAIAEELVKKGLKVVGIARRVERVEELKKSLKNEKGELYPMKCDVMKQEDIEETFKVIKKKLGGVDILSISPGAVETEFVEAAQLTAVDTAKIPLLASKDIADAVLFAIAAPPHVQIHEMIVKPVGENISMERWAGRVAVVTGASSGIGAAIAEKFVKNGLKVAGLARRVERVEELKTALKKEKGELHPIKCDVSNPTEIKEAFKEIKKKYGGVDILINNAGTAFENTLIGGPEEHWKGILDLNVLGLSVCTKQALDIMKENGVDDGHIVHINSVVGHQYVEGGYFYTASKRAVTALTEGLRRELAQKESKIKITSVSPGAVKTEFLTTSKITSISVEQAKKMMNFLESEDVADAVELKVLLKEEKGELHAIKCDLSNSTEIKEAFKEVKKRFGGVDILVNNAGTAFENTLLDGPEEHWKGILDLNVLSLSICTKQALDIMKENGVDDGHIIHINSIVGHDYVDGIYFYTASKRAVTALTEGLRRELANKESKIRSVSPGMVKTEFRKTSKYSASVQEQDTKIMERWVGRVAVVTGASSGIGAAIAKELVKNGLKVVGLARRVEKVEEQLLEAGPEEHWKGILDLNVLGLSVCTKQALDIMKENGVDDGHIVHINSIVGHTYVDGGFMYGASKRAVTALTEGLRRELVKQSSKIRITIHEIIIKPVGEKM